jgi:choline dehydrogenase-like flavoprotein
VSDEFDLCVIGSGAGGGPVAAVAAEKGYRVLVLEKGPWIERDQFCKDEVTFCRRPPFRGNVREEPMVEELYDAQGRAFAQRTAGLWNANVVGGSSIAMSGFFLRMKPVDFRMRSVYGPVEGADVADWPIRYEDLEPWYARIEEEVGVSGWAPELPAHLAEPRSTPDFPFEATREHPIADHIDRGCDEMGLHPFATPRAVLPEDWTRNASGTPIKRRGCAYAGYCAMYGCRTGAKGSSLEAFLPRALATGRCEIRPRSMVTRLLSDRTGKVVQAEYVDAEGRSKRVSARIFAVACQAIESARLLLSSVGPRHPQGLANSSGLVGRNLLYSTYGAGWGEFPYSKRFRHHESNDWLRSQDTFVNRSLQDWYFIDDPRLGKRKGGTIDFLLQHPNPIANAHNQAVQEDRPGTSPLWGQALKRRLKGYFEDALHLKWELFVEWYADHRARVTLDPRVKDKWGNPVARVNTYSHIRNREAARYLADRAMQVMRGLEAENVRSVARFGGPSTNLVGGTCRFGDDPRRSVLDRDCRAHDVPNLFVTDASFMPSGGGVPFTFTIYANARRVAERIVEQLGGERNEAAASAAAGGR